MKQLHAVHAVYGNRENLSPSQKELLQIVDRKREQLAKSIMSQNEDSQKQLAELLDWGIGNLKGGELEMFLNGVDQIVLQASPGQNLQVVATRGVLGEIRHPRLFC